MNIHQKINIRYALKHTMKTQYEAMMKHKIVFMYAWFGYNWHNKTDVIMRATRARVKC